MQTARKNIFFIGVKQGRNVLGANNTSMKFTSLLPARFAGKILFSLLLACVFSSAFSQQPTQTVRGTVLDKVSQSPVIGAVVMVLNTEPAKGATTDVNGQFIIRNVPVGKQHLRISCIGYKEMTMSNITVNAGKEVVLNVQAEEQVIETKEVVVQAKVEKNKPLNEMSTVSTRTFSVEETQKFAAAVNDPARMATAFAGVVSGNDGNNTISIRGNSPNGLLWRMEGVDIPNPNHFSAVGTSGGGISILSAQLLSNSDFMTGAFAAEYGNAMGGVFDLKLRKGNNEKREYTFQAGVLGIDVATEGPFKKGYGGSYLVNYRYSSLSLLSMMGVNIVGDAVTNFQDLSFNVSLPAGKAGTFGVWGFGGISTQVQDGEKDSSVWKDKEYKQYPSSFRANTGAFGINHAKLFGTRTFLKTTLLFSGTDNAYTEHKMGNNYVEQLMYEESNVQSKVALSSVITHKLSARSSIRSGVILSLLNYDLLKRPFIDSLQTVQTLIESSGQTATVQAYTQWNYKIGSRLTTNAGMHALWLTLNNTYSLEPRASVKYDLNAKQYVAFGYGLHGQIQPLGAYFSKAIGGTEYLNKDLGISKAHHFVLSHDISLDEHTHVKTEAYYQYLFNIPVSTDPASTFSMLNVTDGYVTQALVNKGEGRNYGLELTVERFLHRNFYYLLSMSLYESKYRAADNNWYNTRFNTNYATTLTMGKEWELSEKRKKRVIGLNGKLMYIGGFRRTPIDLGKSVAAGDEVYVESQSFTVKNPDYFRLDVRVSLKRNYAHSTSTVSLDLQNATNHQNIGGQHFDKKTGTVKYFYQAGLIPVLSYRIEF